METGVIRYREPLSSGYSLPSHYNSWHLVPSSRHSHREYLESLMRFSSRTPRRLCGADHRKKLRVQTMRIIYIMYSDFDHSNSLHTAICRINSQTKVPRNGFELHRSALPRGSPSYEHGEMT